MERRGGEFRRIEFAEQRFERDYLAGWNSPRQHCSQLLPDGRLAVSRSSFGAVEVERCKPSTRELAQPCDFPRSGKDHYLNRLCHRDALEFSWRDRRLEKDDGVRRC